jgi:hypothetical protein
MGKILEYNKSYSYTDLLLSIIVLLIALVSPTISLTKDDSSFWQTLIKIILVQLSFYSIGNLISIVYIRIKTNRTISKWMNYINVNAPAVIGFPLFIVIGLLYSIVINIDGMYLSTLFSIITGFYFGFSVGVNYRISYYNRTEEVIDIEKSFEHPFQSNLPYIILFYCTVFLYEYYGSTLNLEKAQEALLFVFMIALYIGIVILVYKNQTILNINENSIINRKVIYSISISIGLIGLNTWDSTIQRLFLSETDNHIYRLLVLVMFGVIPLRLIPVIFEKHNWKIKTCNLISICVYIIMKI